VHVTSSCSIIIIIIIRLHRMHEIQTIITNVRGVCQSVCPSISLSVVRLKSGSLCKNGWTEQDAVWGNTLGGLWNIVLHWGPDFPHRGGGEPTFQFWDPPRISGMAEAIDLKFCMHIAGRRPEWKLCKSKSYWSTVGSRDLLLNFGTPKLLWPFVIIIYLLFFIV